MVKQQDYDIREILPHIDPSLLDYQDWINVGMALKDAGYAASDWDNWSRSDSRYHDGECFKKWGTFNGSSNPVTLGTVVQLAKDQGWEPPGHEEYEIGWNDYIGGKDDLVVIDSDWLEGKELAEPKKWEPAKEIIKYLETLFESTENVGYVTETWEKDGKYLPTKGSYGRTAGELIQLLGKCKDNDIGAVFGDYKEEAGAWIRFNPLDGKGVKNDNVTDYRYALVESDTVEIEKQNAILRELELPIAALVHSGKKSLHAIVKIDAGTYDEYRKRVEYLYTVCKKNGLKVDTQNKNPSRLSRMPGVIRNGKKQYLIDTHIGKENWQEWQEWIESVNDELPDPESLADEWNNLPELAEPLIDNVLRKGHKMLIAGPSKAGKSFALIEMVIAIAEGRRWWNWQCAKGKVLYVNLELDRASCLHRFKDVYTKLGWNANNLKNIDIWNLRGKSVPMDKLAPKLIRRASKKDYIAIVIDPIYKVITGDENSADQMAHFCNQFDKICTDLGCAVIYCHHHSKGGQGGKKSMDRASGSGVFARDPDALLDLIELEPTEDLIKQEVNKAICDECLKWLDKHVPDYDDEISQDDMCSKTQMLKKCRDLMSRDVFNSMQPAINNVEKVTKSSTAWRLEGTLREFPKFEPVNLWFKYPVHETDKVGSLKDLTTEPTQWHKTWKQNFKKNKPTKEDRNDSLEMHFDSCASFNNSKEVTLQDLAESMGVTEKTVRNRAKEHGGFWIEDGKIGKK